jgi:hypothetical protein
MAVSAVVVEADNDANESPLGSSGKREMMWLLWRYKGRMRRGLIRYKHATVTARVEDLPPGGRERGIRKRALSTYLWVLKRS